MFWFFRRKKEIVKLKEDIQKSFDFVKQDFKKVGEWVEHLDGKHKNHNEEISAIKMCLSAIQNDLEEIKSINSFFNTGLSKHLFKQTQTPVYKQTSVEVVQTPVQTAVQTGILSNLTLMERAIIWALLNSHEDMKLSYGDLAALLGKKKSTIRGQINTLKQKNEGLIEEQIEANGRKRLYIPENMKNFILKSVKVRVKSNKKSKKSQKVKEDQEKVRE